MTDSLPETTRTRWEELETLKNELAQPHPSPDGDSCCLVHDEPIFGLNNPPEPGAYHYHYTSVETLSLIAASRSLKFRPLGDMNDPHEALDFYELMTGLRGPAGEPLTISPEDQASFMARD